MIAKELIDARWKAIIGAALGLFTVLVGAFTFDILRNAINPQQLDQVSKILGPDFAFRLTNYGAYMWGQAFAISGNNGIAVLIIAALIGASLIAGEVSKGSIFLLLSRPLSRERILLTKYGVGAAVLLGMNVLAGLVLYVASVIASRPQDIGGVAISVLLFWLGSLFVLGLATLFSIVFNDLLRPLALTVVVVLLLNLPGLIPHGADWVLPGYWSSLPAFLGQEFPLKALIISLIGAAIPLILAIPLFKRQAY